jgi:hypothetical protein
MNNNIEIKMDTTTKFVNNIYDELSYFDLYGNSAIIFIFITLFVFLVHSYCKVMETKESIANDWTNQRCKPQNIPFAGYITKPEGKTAFEYTSENFQYCVQNILLDITNYALAPFQFMVGALKDIYQMIENSIQEIRNFMNLLRNNVKTFTEDVLYRILNVMIPIQQMFIALIDSFNKVQGIMTSGLYTMLGTYYTLKSLMGAILEFIIKILIALVVIIVALWILPFTWPAAASMSAVFVAIAIPLAIITAFMKEVLHVKVADIPKLRCFDKKTKFILNNRTTKYIQDIEVGDILENGAKITAKFKVLTAGLTMYNLKGTTISESHIVKYEDKWIPVREHPDAVKLYNYVEPYLYCLNTSTKIIELNDTIFTDWDEIYDDKLEKIINITNKIENNFDNNLENIHKYLDNGFCGTDIVSLENEDKEIKDIKIGEKTDSGGFIYGVVEIETNNLRSDLEKRNNSKLYHLLTTNKSFTINNKIVDDYNQIIDKL